jgi:hypothetical protein
VTTRSAPGARETAILIAAILYLPYRLSRSVAMRGITPAPSVPHRQYNVLFKGYYAV